MNFTKTLFWMLMATFFMAGCKSKKVVNLSGEEPVEISDFIEFFPEKKLPFQVADTSLQRKDPDSLLINYKVFTQFIPDSVITKQFGKTKPRIFPIGRANGDDTYLFAKAIAGDKRVAYALAFDKKKNYIASFVFLQVDQNPATQQVTSMDNRYTITRSLFRKNADGSVSDGKEVYVLNAGAADFMLIMTDALDDKVTELINPIDTLSRKQKFTADYGSGAMNLFSFRDGRKSDRLTFFLHFEKNNGECTGELKGEAMITGTNKATYRSPGDPCALQFTFTASSVIVKELEPCGSRRGLRCSFDGTYARKKEAKPKPAKATKPGTK